MFIHKVILSALITIGFTLSLQNCANGHKNVKRSSSNASVSDIDSADGLPASACKASSLRLQKSPRSNKDFFLAEQGYQIIEGNSLTVISDNETKTLCDVLLETKKKTAIFQFASIKEPDKVISINELFNQDIMQDVAHIIVFVDLPSKLSTKKVDSFLEEFVPEGIPARDDKENLWRMFAKNSATPSFPTIVVMNKNMQSYISNEPITDLDKAISIVEDLIAQVQDDVNESDIPKPDIEDDVKVLDGWDRISFRGNSEFKIKP